MACNGSVASRCFQAGARYANAEFIQVHPTAVPGADKLRLMSESARGEGGRVWVPRQPQDSRDPRTIPESQRYYFLEDRYPAYGNLVPRDIATREIFNVCVREGLSVEKDRQCVYLDLTHLDRGELDRKLAGILEIYEKFVGEDPRDVPMKIFPAVHYSMGGLWVDYQADSQGGLVAGSPRNQQTDIEGLYAIGECDYQYHGANRLGANSLLSCIFAGLFVGPGLEQVVRNLPRSATAPSTALFDTALRREQHRHQQLLSRSGNGPNPYHIHQQLGDVMTRAATVVRHNDDLDAAYQRVSELYQQAQQCTLSDTGNWTNQNIVFTKALIDMFPLALAILKGARMRDECRGAHFKPEFDMPDLKATDVEQARREAEQWCDRFEEKNRRWLKTSVATWDPSSGLKVEYEDVHTELIPPRPRLYGVVGGEMIERVWRERRAAQAERPGMDGNGETPGRTGATAAGHPSGS
jgi:succinate dehydrogenase / fumarate reductase flavoprotein subunit